MEARAVGIAVAQWATEARVGSDNDKFQLTKLNSARTEHQILPICIYPHLGGCDKQGCRTPALKALSCSFRECQKNAGNVEYGYVFPTLRNYFPAFC